MFKERLNVTKAKKNLNKSGEKKESVDRSSHLAP
jgi:hypothetical protein